MKNRKKSSDFKHPLDRKFATIEEAAKAKTDYVMNTVFKDTDWSTLKR